MAIFCFLEHQGKKELPLYKVTVSSIQYTDKLQSQKKTEVCLQPKNYTVVLNGETHSV